jgi:uncharacterized protein
MKDTYTLNADCFVIPYEEKGMDTFIAYFPLQSLIFEINGDAAEILNSIKKKPYSGNDQTTVKFLKDLVSLNVINRKKETQPYVPFNGAPTSNNTMLLLTEKCMLRCLYCYKAAQERGKLMSIRVAKAAIDTIIKNAKEQNRGFIDLGYHGGGEPTINWKVLTESFYYAKERCVSENLYLKTSICTNGIMSKKKALWIIENIQSIMFSIDGPSDIHNKQRPFHNGKASFDKVATTIDLFNHFKKTYGFRITATEFSNGRLCQILKYLIDRFHPPVICIEPLFVCGRCETSGCLPPDEDQFISEMKEATNLGAKTNTPIQYSGNRISYLQSRFCGAQGSNFFITPCGDVTACLEVSSRHEPRADFFIYGKFNPEKNKFDYDKDKYHRLAQCQVQNLESCKDCFAKWHCSGDCIAKTPDFTRVTKERNLYRCKINKALIKDTLIKTMNDQIRYSMNKTVLKSN